MLLATILDAEISAVVTRDGLTLSKSWTSIPRAHLTEEAWYWYMVSCHNLLPKVVNSSVTRPSMLLLYTLLKNMRVNVGSLIHQALTVKSIRATNLFFLTLIYGLCKKARVKGFSTLWDTLLSLTYMVPSTPFHIEALTIPEPPNELQTALEAMQEELQDLRQ